MSFMKSMDVLSAGMHAQRVRLDVVSTNLANAETTRTAEGGAYKRKEVSFRAVPVDGRNFDAALKSVDVDSVAEAPIPTRQVYDPSHPDADPASGLVEMPNVNVVEEMVDLMTATRSFEANVTAFEALRQMVNKAMEIGR
jgi:flagellar basal-body rod protein FlgC